MCHDLIIIEGQVHLRDLLTEVYGPIVGARFNSTNTLDHWIKQGNISNNQQLVIAYCEDSHLKS